MMMQSVSARSFCPRLRLCSAIVSVWFDALGRGFSMAKGFSDTPKPPYYAVIFTTRLSHSDEGCAAMGDIVSKLSEGQPGYLGMETTRGADRLGITVSYWRDEDCILAWKADFKHLLAQKNCIARRYEHCELRVAKVRRAYNGPHGRSVG